MTEHMPTPWMQGTPSGYNASGIYDANGEGICQVYGIPLHTKVADVPPEYRDGMERAALIVRAVNSHAAMKAALEELIFQIAGDQHDAAEIDKAFGTKLLGAAITRARRALEEA